MKPLISTNRIVALLAACLFASTPAGAQVWSTIKGPGFTVPSGQVADIYPATAVASGLQPYLTNISIGLPLIWEKGTFGGLDLMLESPSGTRVVFFSDWECPGGWDLTKENLRFAYDASAVADLSDCGGFFTYMRPANFGSGPDTFPAPGPGPMAAGPSTFAPFINENPNGTWKLWAVNDKPDSGGLILAAVNDWTLYLLHSAAPTCPIPELINVDVIGETQALVSWASFDASAHFDLYYGKFGELPNPDDDLTTPTVADWNNDTILLTDLAPGTDHALYNRSRCGNGTKSGWRFGPSFRTEFIPCNHTLPIGAGPESCQRTNCSTIPGAPYSELKSDCGTFLPRYLFRFTPTETRPYFFDQTNPDFYTKAYILPDTAGGCPTEGWTCHGGGPNLEIPFLLDTLTAGVPYVVMIENPIASPDFSITACPLAPLGYGTTEIFTDSIEMYFYGQTQLTAVDSMEVYVGPSPLSPPGQGTPPSTGARAEAATGSIHIGGLAPATVYDIYLRRRIGPLTSCWQGPIMLKTGELCASVEWLKVDTVTYSTADIALKWHKTSPNQFVGASFRLCKPDDDPRLQWADEPSFLTVGGDTLRGRMQNIPSWQPLKIFVQMGCLGLGKQPWLGPFDLPAGQTPPVRIHDIYCGEENTTLPDHDHFEFKLDDVTNGLVNTIQIENPGYSNNLSNAEKLFRFRSTVDDTLKIEWTGEGYTGSDDYGTGFFWKSATTFPGNQGWAFLGKWMFGTFDPASYPSFSLPVKKDSTYYLLCDAFANGTLSGGAPFSITGCSLTCPPVDTVFKKSATPTSIELGWAAAAPGASYIVERLSGDNLLAASKFSPPTTDTTILLTGLDPLAEYEFWVRSICPDGGAGPRAHAKFQLASPNLAKTQTLTDRCNPVFTPHGEAKSTFYEEAPLEVAADGTYFLKTSFPKLFLYKDGFDPKNPSTNLVAAVSHPDLYDPADTAVALAAAGNYTLVAAFPVDLNQTGNGGGLVTFIVDGPAAADLQPTFWNARQPQPHGLVPDNPSDLLGNQVCPDTSGWLNIYARAADPTDPAADRLLLSVKGYAHPENFINSMHLFVSGQPGASHVTNPPAPFVQNPSGWYEMNRFWNIPDVSAATQPDGPISVRFYYTSGDFDTLRTVIEAAGGKLDSHEAMYFHKINGFHDFSVLAPWLGHPGIPAATSYDGDGLWEYANGPEASTTNWRHGQLGAAHFGEMVVRYFSGGGGGASVNGRAATDTTGTIKTVDLGGGLGSLALFPNPVVDELTVDWHGAALPPTVLEISDGLGRVVRSMVAPSGAERLQVPMGKMPGGVYHLKINRIDGPPLVLKLLKI